jgi:hypothetical protein
MLLQRCCPSDYAVVGWRVVMAVTKMRFRAISRRRHEKLGDTLRPENVENRRSVSTKALGGASVRNGDPLIDVSDLQLSREYLFDRVCRRPGGWRRSPSDGTRHAACAGAHWRSWSCPFFWVSREPIGLRDAAKGFDLRG